MPQHVLLAARPSREPEYLRGKGFLQFGINAGADHSDGWILARRDQQIFAPQVDLLDWLWAVTGESQKVLQWVDKALVNLFVSRKKLLLAA